VLLPSLKKLQPQAEITWVTCAAALPLLEQNPHIDRIALINDLGDSWHNDEYDWVLSLDDELGSARLAAELRTIRLSGAYAKTCSTPRYTEDMAEWFGMGLLRPDDQGGLSHANELKRQNQHSYGSILYQCLNLPLPVTRPQIFVPPEIRQQVLEWVAGTALSTSPKIVGLNTGAGERWRFKKWGEQQTAALAIELKRKFDVGVVLLGGEQEKERNERIRKMADGACVGAPIDWDLKRFAALIGICRVVVSSDSLALHLTVANGVPAVVFFGPTSAAEIDLFGLGSKVTTPLSCKCCYLSSCDVRPHCMDSIQVEQILLAVSRWLT
jgi:heptosyltransferase-2